MKNVFLEPVEFYLFCREITAVGISFDDERGRLPNPDELVKVLQSATVVPNVNSNKILVQLSVDDSVWPKLCKRVQWGFPDKEIHCLGSDFRGLGQYYRPLCEKFMDENSEVG